METRKVFAEECPMCQISDVTLKKCIKCGSWCCINCSKNSLCMECFIAKWTAQNWNEYFKNNMISKVIE